MQERLLDIFQPLAGNETSEKYSWNPKKREQNIKERGLGDSRSSYGEDRYLAYGLVNEKIVSMTGKEMREHFEVAKGKFSAPGQ